METAPSPRTREEIISEIARLDKEIMELTSAKNLARIPGENELGTSLDDSAIEGELNDADFAQRQAMVNRLHTEQAELRAALEILPGAK